MVNRNYFAIHILISFRALAISSSYLLLKVGPLNKKLIISDVGLS